MECTCSGSVRSHALRGRTSLQASSCQNMTSWRSNSKREPHQLRTTDEYGKLTKRSVDAIRLIRFFL